MKANRNTIYITLFMTIVSALIYTYCIFGWNAVCITSSKWNTYISNLCLGIWGSSIISLFIGFTSYKESRKKCMERFIHASRKLFNHSALIRENNSKKWFDEYVDLYQELSDSWADIWFLFDPRRHRLYLKACVDFYGDFIQLTQDNYYLLDQSLGESTKQSLLDSIYKIAIKEKTINRGIMHFHVNENNLTTDMELVIKRIDNIYKNKEICKSYVFNKSLLNKDTFVTLDQKYEKYIRKFVKAIDEEHKTEIAYVMPIEDAEYLIKAGYLHGYTHGTNKTTAGVDCRFIVDHYFDMKKRVKTEVP